jgi:hypothetical protein
MKSSVLSVDLSATPKGNGESRPLTLTELLGLTESCHRMLHVLGTLAQFVEVYKVRAWYWDDCPNGFDVNFVINPFGLEKVEISMTFDLAAVRTEQDSSETIASHVFVGLYPAVLQTLSERQSSWKQKLGSFAAGVEKL